MCFTTKPENSEYNHINIKMRVRLTFQSSENMLLQLPTLHPSTSMGLAPKGVGWKHHIISQGSGIKNNGETSVEKDSRSRVATNTLGR